MFNNSPEQKHESDSKLGGVQSTAFSRFNELVERSIEGIATKVEELKARHPGAYDACLGLLSTGFEKDANDIKGTLADYFKTLAHAYHTAPYVIERISRGEFPELKFAKLSPTSPLACTLKLDESGEYRLRLSFQAPGGQPGQRRDVAEYNVESRNGHFFFWTVSDLLAEPNTGATWESLGALDGALPFRSDSQLEQMAEPLTVERAYLLAFSDFIDFRPNPEGGAPLRDRVYHLIELPGADLGAKLEGAERFLACSNPASTHMAREAMPDGHRPGLASWVGLPAVMGYKLPPFENVVQLVERGAPGEWSILQSKSHPTFNDLGAYVFVRRRTEQVVSPDAPSLLIPVQRFPRAVSGPVCEAKQGRFEPLGAFGTLIEDAAVSPTFNRDTWVQREVDSLRLPG